MFGDLFDLTLNNAFTMVQLSDSSKLKNLHHGDILVKFRVPLIANSYEIPYIEKEIYLSCFSEECYLQSGNIVIAYTAEDETVVQAL